MGQWVTNHIHHHPPSPSPHSPSSLPSPTTPKKNVSYGKGGGDRVGRQLVTQTPHLLSAVDTSVQFEPTGRRRIWRVGPPTCQTFPPIFLASLPLPSSCSLSLRSCNKKEQCHNCPWGMPSNTQHTFGNMRRHRSTSSFE